MKLSVSNGNAKMGAVPSVSLPPVITCAAGCKCAQKCYAARLCRIRKNVREAYANNLELWRTDPDAFELQAMAAASTTRFFRWHVAGDIVSPGYLAMMARIAERLPHTEFLAFTKQYDTVNAFATENTIPGNLNIIFSAWPGMYMDNPHNFPVAQVIFKGQAPADGWKVCGGNCAECACRGVGCWQLQPGETICFAEH